MKTVFNPELRTQALELRRTHTAKEVSERTGIPLNTLKSIKARASKPNERLRALCTLPEVSAQPSNCTSLRVASLPPQVSVSGDAEVDAVLWLHEVIATGVEADIEKALEAAKRLPSDIKDIEKRHSAFLARSGGSWVDSFRSIWFSDLPLVASRRLDKLRLQREALARFGGEAQAWAETPMETFVFDTLANVDGLQSSVFLPKTQVQEAFDAVPELKPRSLSDCLHELTYWDNLYSLRSAFGTHPDDCRTWARSDYVSGLMATIRPKDREEGEAVFDYVTRDSHHMSEQDLRVLRNLIR